MARITVEDCIDKFPSRFELVLVASQRARKLYSGERPAIDVDNDKNTVIALREIADSALTPNEMKENLIQEYQTVTLSDEEEEVFELESFNQEIKENNESQSNSTDVEEEIKELVSSEDNEIKEQSEDNEIKEQSEDNEIKEQSEDNEIKEQSEIRDDTVVNKASDESEENTNSLE